MYFFMTYILGSVIRSLRRLPAARPRRLSLVSEPPSQPATALVPHNRVRPTIIRLRTRCYSRIAPLASLLSIMITEAHKNYNSQRPTSLSPE